MTVVTDRVVVIFTVTLLCLIRLWIWNPTFSWRLTKWDGNHPFSTRRKLKVDEGTSLLDFENVINASQAVLSLIRNRYELAGPVGSQFFLTANNMAAETWDIMKYKYASKICRKGHRRGNETFLMIFAGSSVTAGHDNFFNQSFPMIVSKRMGPILSKVGIELIVHNIAQGANNCLPYSYCYESMGGIDPDFIGWEQAYNCGRDDSVFELVGRVGGRSKNKAVLYYSASGAWIPSKCPPSTDLPPFSSEEWTPAAAGLPEWKPSRADLKSEKALLNKYHSARPSASRFVGAWADKNYKALGAHGFNVWEPNPLCNYTKKGAEAKGCSGIDSTMECSMRFMSKEAALYGNGKGGAAWHPSRAFHMLRGEAITWLYTMAFLDSIYVIQDGLREGKSLETMAGEFDKALKELQPPIPSIPKRCAPLHCESKATCYTDYKPHYSDFRLSDLVIGSTNWTYDPASYGNWSLTHGYLDAKPSYESKGVDANEIHLKLKVSTVDTALVCGPHKGALTHAVFYLDKDVPEHKLKNYARSPSRSVTWRHRKEAGFEGCAFLSKLPRGEHVLSVVTNSTHRDHKYALSHVIVWE